VILGSGESGSSIVTEWRVQPTGGSIMVRSATGMVVVELRNVGSVIVNSNGASGPCKLVKYV
jgi:hypothetical protein